MQISCRRFLTTLLVFALFTAACGDDDSSADADDVQQEPEQTKVTVAVGGSSMQLTWANYTSIPIELGYYADEGIDVEIQSVPGSGEILQAIAAGQADFGVILSPPLFAAANEDLDVKAFYNMITSNFSVPHVLEDSPIQSVKDLEGATIGVLSLGAGSVPLIRSMVARAGGDPDSLEFVAVGGGADVAPIVESGEVDVLGLWDSVYGTLATLGVELRPISDPFFDDLGFQGVVLASADALEDDPELFAGIGRAIAKATVFMMENPEAAVQIHWSRYPDARPAGVDEETAVAGGATTIELRNEALEPVDGQWGAATAESIKTFGEVLVEGGAIDRVPLVEDLYTDEMIDEINDFDPAPIVNDAQAYEVG